MENYGGKYISVDNENIGGSYATDNTSRNIGLKQSVEDFVVDSDLDTVRWLRWSDAFPPAHVIKPDGDMFTVRGIRSLDAD